MPEKEYEGRPAVQHVNCWHELYKQIYGQATAPADGTFDIAGWLSSYTGLPIPAGEMREWMDRTVERILALRPKRVLEIGCGTGLLLFRIAPSCERYVAVDFVDEVLNRVQDQLNRLTRPLPQVELLNCKADQVGNVNSLRSSGFDTIVLNSVVQYFPDITYLVRVVTAAMSLLAPSGSIFLGDVRSRALLEALATSIEIGRAPKRFPIASLRDRIARRISAEQELTIDPEFFAALADRLPGLAAVRAEPKRGAYDNELSRFRYDVTLFRVPVATALIPEAIVVSTIFDLRMLLADAKGDTVCVSGLRDRRVIPALEVAARVAAAADAQVLSSDLLDGHDASTEGVEWDEIDTLAKQLGWTADLQLSIAVGYFDALFCRGLVKDSVASWPMTGKPNLRCAWSEYANNPARGMTRRQLVPELRALLETRVPEVMLPSSYVLLDHLPLTPNGKVDRANLPLPDAARPDLAAEFVAPHTTCENAIASIWAEVIGIDTIGGKDDFFSLGGHSLLATQVISSVRSKFGIELPLRALFEHRTLSAFATAVEAYITSEIEKLSEEEAQQLVTRRPDPDVCC